MRYLLDLLYCAGVSLFSPWLLFQAIARGKYRQGWAAKLLGRVPHFTGDRRRVWLHAVSVGEVNLLEPVLRELRTRRPDYEFVVSTTTRAGFELACKRFGQEAVFYAPLDFSWAVEQAMRRVRPALLILVELEVWPNLIATAERHGARVAVINGRLSDRSFRGYSQIQRYLKSTFARLDLVAAQTEVYAERFRTLGTASNAIFVSGSVKFDHAVADRANERTKGLAELAKITSTDRVFLVGSTQAPEESLAVAAFQALQHDFPQLRLIVVPRHPERFEEVARQLQQSGLPWERRSQFPQLDPQRTPARILLVDTIGELGDWWGTAHYAYVGGSLGKRGGQNMIEPAAYGAAVAFGPCTHNFRDVVEQLLARNAARVLSDGSELLGWLHECLADPVLCEAMGERARSLVASQRGATRRTVDRLLGLLGDSSNGYPSATCPSFRAA